MDKLTKALEGKWAAKEARTKDVAAISRARE
jgi:hypothetical protein